MTCHSHTYQHLNTHPFSLSYILSLSHLKFELLCSHSLNVLFYPTPTNQPTYCRCCQSCSKEVFFVVASGLFEDRARQEHLFLYVYKIFMKSDVSFNSYHGNYSKLLNVVKNQQKSFKQMKITIITVK